MPTVKVVHLHEQGQDMIIVPLNSDFGNKASDDQQRRDRGIVVACK
jgi:hypothetical protein